MRNNVRLQLDDVCGIKESHFKLYEFEGDEGLVVVSDRLILALELLRFELNGIVVGDGEGTEAIIKVTSGTRTLTENAELAKKYGWTDQGGTVSKESRHLPKFGGIAADIIPYYVGKTGAGVVPKVISVPLCRKFFDYVNANYSDNHIHCDLRHGGKKL